MRKKITLSFIAFLSILALTSAITNGSGSPYGRTGSPGDGSNCTHCHGGTPTTDTFITTNIPASGYVPATTYTISIAASKAGINKFGFEITAEDSLNNKVGTFAITNTAETKMVQDEVTHTGSGTTTSNNQKSWSMNWTAPAAGTGDIGFYSAVNAANGNGGTSGDQIILSSLMVMEDVTNSIAENTDRSLVSIYPTVSSDYINITSGKEIKRVMIYDAMGKTVITIQINSNRKTLKIDISSLSSGIYLAHIQMGSKTVISRFIKEN